MSKYINIARKHNLMNKAIDALNVMHNKQEYTEKYRRNQDTLNLLLKLEFLHPQIRDAVNEELKVLFTTLEELNRNRVKKTGKPYKTVKLGLWWIGLIKASRDNIDNDPYEILMKDGSLKIEVDSFMKSTSYYESQGYGTTNDCINILLHDREPRLNHAKT